jgi:hypothetical protein
MSPSRRWALSAPSVKWPIGTLFACCFEIVGFQNKSSTNKLSTNIWFYSLSTLQNKIMAISKMTNK